MKRALLALAAVAGVMLAEPPIASAQVGEDKYAQNGEVKIHYKASGKGPLVVMIHGYPDFSGTWDELTPKLNDAYRVVAIDTRGYNLSDKPVGVENYEMPKLVADIDAVIKAEGYEKATVLGHDWGASQAWMYAFTHPERVENLIILSVPHPTLFMQQMRTNPAQQASSQYARNFQKEGSEKTMTAEGLANWVRDPAKKAKYIEAFKRSSFAGMMNYYRANYPKTAGPDAKRPFLPDPVPQLDVPLLVIHGVKDTALLAPGHNGTWEKTSKDTTLVMVPDAGHFVQHDAEALVNRQVRTWLDAHKSAK